MFSFVRNGQKSSVLIFVRIASEKYLNSRVYESRLQDWLHGVRTAVPDKDVARCFEEEPVTEAERLRLAYLLITQPKNEGGAGITPGVGPWANVASVFPMHDHDFNRAERSL